MLDFTWQPYCQGYFAVGLGLEASKGAQFKRVLKKPSVVKISDILMQYFKK